MGIDEEIQVMQTTNLSKYLKCRDDWHVIKTGGNYHEKPVTGAA